MDRRTFLGLTAAAALAPPARAADAVPGKDALRVLNDRPLNAETPAHLLDDDVTPASRMFVRNNGLPPTDVDPASWTLTIDGEAAKKPVTLSLADLAAMPQHTYQLLIECAGNGRSEFYPPARGNQWSTGAVHCARWTGVRLAEVLAKAGVADNAVYVGYYGADMHLSGQPDKDPISRGIPIAKALQPETLIALKMNDGPIPALHGHPLRLVVGGWPGSCSGKWLNKLVIRDRVHDGTKMTGMAYRVPCEPVAPGQKVPEEAMCIIEEMPVKSLISKPQSGAIVAPTVEVAGHAWAGERRVVRVEVSSDFGATWVDAKVSKPANRLSWQRFETTVTLPGSGYWEIWARATDDRGIAQPMVLPGWNPKGYLNNACHRVAVRVA